MVVAYRDGDYFAALAGNGQRPVAPFDTESLNGRTAIDLFRTPQLLSTRSP